MNENQGKGGQELSQDDIDRLINGDVGLSDDKGKDASQDKLAEEWAQALEAGEDIQEGKPLGKSAERASFEELQQGRPANGSADLDFILDIPLEVTVEMGRTRMLIHDLLQLGQGSVIELNRRWRTARHPREQQARRAGEGSRWGRARHPPHRYREPHEG